MRNALLSTAAAILLITYLWPDDPVEFPKQPAQPQLTGEAPTQTAPTGPQPSAFLDWRAQETPDAGLAFYPQDKPEPFKRAPRTRSPAATHPAATPGPAPERPLDLRPEEVAGQSTLVEARPIQPVAIAAGSNAGFEADQDDWRRGTLTLQGSFGYYPPEVPAGAPSARVTIAAKLSCAGGKGVLYYRDPAERVEWMSSEFAFDARALCASQQERLDSLASGFDAYITGAYAPLTINDFWQIEQGGLFQLGLVGGDSAVLSRSAVKLCLALQDGAYRYYVLPENPRNWSATPLCTFLDSFTVQRNL